jgi:hypothetical protein
VNQPVWLASYPKSGNTWFWMLAHAGDLQRGLGAGEVA